MHHANDCGLLSLAPIKLLAIGNKSEVQSEHMIRMFKMTTSGLVYVRSRQELDLSGSVFAIHVGNV